jgi:carbonic anhydrase
VREAGNIADSPTNLGSLEYSQLVLGSQLVLVLGHTSCGAVGAAFDGAMPPGNIQSIVDAIKSGIQGAETLNEAIVDSARAGGAIRELPRGLGRPSREPPAEHGAEHFIGPAS